MSKVQILRSMGLAVGLAGFMSFGAKGQEAPDASMPCDHPEAPAWVSEAAERVRAYDALLAFAVDRFSEPTDCEGSVTSEFDGARFGILRFSFGSGVSFEFETMPPAVSIVTLRSDAAFEDPQGVVAAVREYASARGLSVDWDEPERSSSEEGDTEQFWDPDPGLNGSVTLIRVDGLLVAVRLSMAP